MNTIEAFARRTIPAVRAQELLDLRSPLLPGWRLMDVGDIRHCMTPAEVRAVLAYWQSLPGSASFASTLGRLARPPEPEPPHYLDRVSAEQAAYYGLTVERHRRLTDQVIDGDRGEALDQ